MMGCGLSRCCLCCCPNCPLTHLGWLFNVCHLCGKSTQSFKSRKLNSYAYSEMSYAWIFSFTLVTLVGICGVTGRFQYFYSVIDGFIPILLDEFVLSQRPSLIERNLLRKIEVHSSKKWYTPLLDRLVWNHQSLGWILRHSKHSYGLD